MNNESYYAKRHTQSLVAIVAISMIALLTITLCIVLVVRNAATARSEAALAAELENYTAQDVYPAGRVQELTNTAREEGRTSVLNQIRRSLENGEGTNNMIRSLFPDKLIVADDGRYYFFEMSSVLKKHGFDKDDFGKDENGFVHYYENGLQDKGIPGIDVSHHQGEIDWEKVAAAGIEYAFIRVGARGAVEGQIFLDDYFEANMAGAKENGIKIGVYFYTQAIDEAEAVEEAEFVIEQLRDYEIEYPVVYDLEQSEYTTARTKNVTKSQHTANTKAFCERIKQAGYTPMIYGNIKTFTLLLDAEEVMEYDTWIAYYNLPQYYPYEFQFWQYSSTGKVPGIETNVDLNIQVPEG
ncbi:MAG: glycoside hydrolase family 25 protein [Lachnospiraceae bacterium]|nr:glycoside hydrolase family 25 protein [Lachnospiraceae bacterium]